MRRASIAMRRKEGKKSLTSVRSVYSIFCLSLRKTKRRYAVAARAAIWTIQNIPILPSITKKSMKLMPVALPSIMEVVSPTRVAAPCKLDATAMAMMPGTGDISSFLERLSAMGATISTVATLSTNALTNPANRESAMIAHLTLGIRAMSRSASRAGILDSMNRATMPMVPAIIMSTFQSIAVANSFQGRMLRQRKRTPTNAAMYDLNFGNANKST